MSYKLKSMKLVQVVSYPRYLRNNSEIGGNSGLDKPYEMQAGQGFQQCCAMLPGGG
jgi:hypothetical protein